ncbi:MAG: EamA family transporter [Flavobacteriaceae bacterium]|nr:MAG: EamA family transporter [Flavobacteriaceae bacterium]
MNTRKIALFAAFLATIVYGLNYTIAKDVMPNFVKPNGFILLRVLGALILFWIAGFFVKKEKIDRKDYITIFLAGLFGAGLNMLTFFIGLEKTTPINASVITVMVPIIVFVISVIFLKEQLIKHRVVGVIIGLTGAIVLIVYGHHTAENAPDIVTGNIFVFFNAIFYSLYLIIVKKLIGKYNPLTFVKWIYLCGFIIVLPFGFNDFLEIDWVAMPINIWYSILFVVLGTTFLTYILNLFALTKLKPTTVSAFVYLQPVVATIFALLMKKDTLDTVKIVAVVFIFFGVYLVSKRPKVKE